MDLEQMWGKAVKETEIIRYRISPLQTFKVTDVPYILLCESVVNPGDTVVRKGHVSVHEPSLLMPTNHPFFEGFGFEENLCIDKDTLRAFFLLRGVSFPSLKYNNEISVIDVFEGCLDKAVKYHTDQLEKEEDVRAGLIVGNDECWQFSVLIFVGGLVTRSASKDIKKLMKDGM
ncbi:hypothetical protein HY792_07100 [Candidatus Desantisbacteria bacterium]|nr:hypothetical protein [Candidatus Desantisbacteria bacterium]